jgi:hypothetical protein
VGGRGIAPRGETIPKAYGIGGLTAYGTLLGDYRYDWLQRELVRPFYFADNERLPQYATEAVLRARAAEIDAIEIRYGWTAERIDQDGETVSAVVAAREGGARETVTGRYLVGCDGSRSIVRQQAGIGQTLSDHDKLMVLLVLRSAGLSRLLERFRGKSFYNVLHPSQQGYWLFFGRVGLDDDWFFHAPVPRGAMEGAFDFEAYLHRAVGAEFDLAFEYTGFWDLRFAIADEYRAGRVFLAGDAAHSHPPYGGYGINTGFEDARNLGWKLAAALGGWADDGLLDSYHAERHAVFASTARDFIAGAIEEDGAFLEAFDPERYRAAFELEWEARSSGARDEVAAFEPHYEGSPVIWAEAGAVSGARGRHCFAARPGHHLAPRPLSSGGNVFDRLGCGLTLLAFDADAATVAAFEAAAALRRVPLVVVRDTASGPCGDYLARLVLVRPDQFVAWSGDATPGDAPLILDRVIGFC